MYLVANVTHIQGITQDFSLVGGGWVPEGEYPFDMKRGSQTKCGGTSLFWTPLGQPKVS